MLPKINRLTKKKDFEVVFKLGKSVKDGFLLYKTMQNQLPQSRFGFVVSKKISSKAVIRNKIKRRLRQAVENHFKEYKTPFDVVVIALSGIEKKEFLELEEKVAKFLNKIH